MQFFTSSSRAILQNVYRKSLYSSLTFFLVLPLVVFFQSKVNQVSFGCTITPHSLTYFIIFNFKPTVFEILICLLHIPLGEQIYFCGVCSSGQLCSICL